jgi:hypothetical protein
VVAARHGTHSLRREHQPAGDPPHRLLLLALLLLEAEPVRFSRRRRGRRRAARGLAVGDPPPPAQQRPAAAAAARRGGVLARVRLLRRGSGGRRRVRGVHRGAQGRGRGAPAPAVWPPVPRRLRRRVAAHPRHVPALPRQRRGPGARSRQHRRRASEPKGGRRRRRGLSCVRPARAASKESEISTEPWKVTTNFRVDRYCAMRRKKKRNHFSASACSSGEKGGW